MTMKGVWRQWALLFVAVAVLGCSKDEDPKPVAITAADFEGEWSINLFRLAGVDKTSVYEGYSFDILYGTDFVINKNGVYDSQFGSYGSYEIDEERKVFSVKLNNPKTDTEYIKGTWQVYEKTDESMTLKSFEQGEKKDFVLTRI